MAVDREFRIRFTGEATQLNESSKEASKNLENLGDKTKDAGKHAENTALSHRELHRALHGIREISPEVGLALQAMVSAPAAGLALLFFLIQRTQKGFEDLAKSTTASEWDPSKLDGIKKSLEAATIEAAKFNHELQEAAKAQESIAEKAAEVAKIHSAESSAMDKIREAQKKFELAQTESIQDPEQKKQKQAEIELRYALDRSRREAEDSKFKTTESHRQLANENFFQEHNAAKVEAARQHLAGLGSEHDVDSRIDTEKARLEKTDKEIEEKQKRFEELEKKFEFQKWPFGQTEQNSLAQQLDQLRTVRTNQQGLIHHLEQRRPGQIIAIQSAQDELSGLEGEQKASVQRSRKLQTDLPTQQRIARIEGGARGQIMATDIAGELSEHHITVRQAIGFLKQGTGGNTGSLISALTELATTMQQMQGQSPNSDEVKTLWKAVNEIQSQLKARNTWHVHF